jgi:hypothetical protein
MDVSFASKKTNLFKYSRLLQIHHGPSEVFGPQQPSTHAVEGVWSCWDYIYIFPISHLKSPSFREVDRGRWSKHVETWANMAGDWTLGSVRLGETLSSKKPGLPGFDGLVQF